MNISESSVQLENGAVATVNLADLAERPSGAWPRGWYPSEIIEGYTAGVHQFMTETTKARKGDSFNLVICFRIKNGEEVRTSFTQVNYRPSDLTAERIALVTNLRKEFAGVKGKWTGFEDAQRSSLALGQLGQLQTATGASFQLDAEGKIIVRPLFGLKPYVHMTINEESGYNEINKFSAYASGVAPKQKGQKKS